MRCEDYPCCGHTDGLPCDWKPPSPEDDPHYYCDHENGECELDPEGLDDDTEYNEEVDDYFEWME